MKILKLIFFILFITSCNENVVKENIDIVKAMENVSDTPLIVNNYFSQIEYIPLETNDSSIIGVAPHIVVAKNIIRA